MKNYAPFQETVAFQFPFSHRSPITDSLSNFGRIGLAGLTLNGFKQTDKHTI